MEMVRILFLVGAACLPAFSQQAIGLAVAGDGSILRATTASITKGGQWTWMCSDPCTGFDYNANDDIAYAVSGRYLHALSGNGVLLWRVGVFNSEVVAVAPVYDSFNNVVWLAGRTLFSSMALPFAGDSVNSLTGAYVAVPTASALWNTSISSSDHVFRVLVKGERAYALSVSPGAKSPIRIYCLRGCGTNKWSLVSPTKSYSAILMPGYNSSYHMPAAFLADGGLVFAERQPFSLDTPRVIYRIDPGGNLAYALTSIPAPPLSANTLACGADQGQTTWPDDFQLFDLVPNGPGFDYFGVAARRGMWGAPQNSTRYFEVQGHFEGGQCPIVSNWKAEISSTTGVFNPVPQFAFSSVSTGCGGSLRPETVNIASAGGASMSVTVSNAQQHAIVWKAASYSGGWFSLGGCKSGVIDAGGSKILQYTATENTSANPRTGVLRFGPETLNLNPLVSKLAQVLGG